MVSLKTVTRCLFLLNEVAEFEISDYTIQAWEMALNDISDEQLEAATKVLSRTLTNRSGKPRPGDIIQIVRDMGGNGMGWAEAWNEICRNASYICFPVYSNGEFQPVEWSNPELPKLMERMGGAQVVWALEQGDLGTARAQFRQMFEGVTKHTGGQLPKLTELAEPQSNHKALPAPEQRRQLTDSEMETMSKLMSFAQGRNPNAAQVVRATAARLSGRMGVES